MSNKVSTHVIPPPPKRARISTTTNERLALNSACIEKIWEIEQINIDANTYLDSMVDVVMEALTFVPNKFYLCLTIQFVKDEDVIETFGFRNTAMVCLHVSDQPIRSAFQEILNNMDAFSAKGSGWTIHKLVSLMLHMVKYEPLAASSYLPLPE